MQRSPSLWMYRLLGTRAEAQERRRARAEGADGRGAERLGNASATRPEGPLVWMQAARGARMPALVQLAERLAGAIDGAHVLLSSDEPVDAVPGTVMHQLSPVDSGSAIVRFLDHWRPDVAVFVGSEILPTAVQECSARGLPLILLDAELGGERGNYWARRAERLVLGEFDHLLTGSQEAAEALRAFGAHPTRIEVPGFLEEGTAALPCNEAERDYLAELLAARPVWLAAGVTAAELDAVAAAHAQASRLSHRLLLILVPASGEDPAGFSESLAARGWTAIRRSTGGEPEEDVQVYIADTEEEMGLWYRLAPISFLASSLAPPGGGVDPYSAAALGSAVIHGPHVARHAAAYGRLAAAGATRRINAAAELGNAVSELLSPDKAAMLAHRAWRVSSDGAEVSDRALELIVAALQRGPAA